MNLQLIRKTIGGAALLCASVVFASQALAAVPLARVIVAKSGGNYTTITAALNAITPTADKPYVIEVWPGVYTETGTIIMKSYVHLKGSGRDVTTVKTSLGTGATVISATGLTNVTISGLTVTGGSKGISLQSTTTKANSATIIDSAISDNFVYGIELRGYSNFTSVAFITGNKITGNRVTGLDVNNAIATIIDNSISGNGNGPVYNTDTGGIFVNHDWGSVISGNIVSGNNGCGIETFNNSAPTIISNVINDNMFSGVCLRDVSTGGKVTNNTIINNGGYSFVDVLVGDGGTSGTPGGIPTISNNVFNDIAGTRGVGAYNSTIDGNPILVP